MVQLAYMEKGVHECLCSFSVTVQLELVTCFCQLLSNITKMQAYPA